MKAQIIKVKGFWRLLYYRPDRNHLRITVVEDYLFADGAFRRWRIIQDRICRELKAWTKLLTVNYEWLSYKEFKFISKMQLRACRNITRRQYGYLTGIIERQRQL